MADTMTSWDRATVLAFSGVPIFPCRETPLIIDGKVIAKDKAPYGNLAPNGFENATTNTALIASWRRIQPGALIGTPTGQTFWVLDVDKDPALEWFVKHRLDFQCSRIQKTQRGFHLYYKVEGTPPTNAEGSLPKGVNVRGLGGYVIAWDMHGYPAEGVERYQLTPAPAWLMDMIRTGAKAPGPVATGDGGFADIALADAPLGFSLSEIVRLLEPIDPDIDYPDWHMCLASVHHETGGSEAGLELVIDWSSNGVKFQSREDVETHWRSYSTTRGNIAGISWLRKFSKEWASRADSLPPLLPSTAAAEINTSSVQTPFARFQLLTAEQFVQRPALRWIIKGLLPQAGLGLIFGPSGAGKSFWLTDLVLHIAEGRAWRGMRTRQARVHVVVAEGAGGYRNRLLAHVRHSGRLIPENLRFTADKPDMFKGSDPLLLAQQIEAAGGADLIVVDTLAATTSGADENSGEDMGLVLTRCDWLHKVTGAMVVLVHHTGKDASRGARGWSGIKGALDVEISVERGERGARLATLTKVKDGAEEGMEYHFRLEPVELGEDEDGDMITSCVIDHIDKTTGDSLRPRIVPVRGLPGLILETIKSQVFQSKEGVDMQGLISQVVAKLVVSGATDRRRDNVIRAINTLVGQRLIRIDDGVNIIVY